MHRFAPVALATILAATAPALLRAQAPTPFTPPQPTAHSGFTDPANLAGERVRPRDGRELPIDGGLGANNQPDNALGLAQMLRRLNTRASLMLIVAHPDDEDGGMLAYYSRGLGARVAVLTLTRGEGGQNAMTGDFEDALGLIRTQELLSADRYMGVDQFFGTEVDFGFSKTKSESFRKWNHERVLYDAVRAVRIYRPLVIAAVFSGAVTDGHGQHQVSGQIAQEVFKAAGDPNVFPELTREGILPWQPLKVFARVPFSRVTSQGLYDYATGQTVPAEFTNYVTGQTFTTEPTADVTVHEGATDPLLTTCAANPADLPSSLSSRPTTTLSSRPENISRHPERSAEREVEGPASQSATTTACRPLSYVQFARIGLGLQRTQIGPGVRNAPSGRFDVGYHLYGSRVCTSSHSSALPKDCHPGRSAQRGVEGPRESSTNHDSSSPFNQELSNAPSFFDGINISLEGIASLAPHAVPSDLLSLLDRDTRAATEQFDPKDPGKIAPALAASLKDLDQLVEMINKWHGDDLEKQNVLHELRVKHAQLEEALALALNIQVEATTNEPNIVTGSDFAVKIRSTTAAAKDLLIPPTACILFQPEASLSCVAHQQEHPNSSATSDSDEWQFTPSRRAVSQITAVATRPYFHRENSEAAVYQLDREDLRGAPATPAPLTAYVTFKYGETTFSVQAVVTSSGQQPVQIIPPISLTFDRNAQILPDNTHSLNVDVHTVTEDHPVGDLRLLAPQDWVIHSPQRTLRTGTETFSASLSSPPLKAPASLKAEAVVSLRTYTEGFRAVGYGTLPRTNFYTPATLRVVPVDLKLPPPNKRRIAYLPGTGDDVPAALASIGLAPTILKVSDLTAANLAHFDTVILGVRTYNAHPDLHGAPTQALFDFARNGGNVVVQYQTNEFSAADAPYPLELRGERVVDETDPVTLLEPDASRYPEASASGLSARSKEKGLQPLGYALLNEPNKITSADFNNWIEERGHGFLDTWDPHYTALTETHDPGSPSEHIADQAPQRGGLITTQLGKGRWTYCAFALYRQLPEAVPGAFRLFVNLLNP